MRKFTLLFISIITITFSTKAQEGFEGILLADSGDSNKLMEAYFAPAMEGFIYGMNNGWYHTAKVHKKFGFDLSLGLNAAQVPTEKELFNIQALGLVSVTSSASTASTFAGPDNETTFTATRTFTFTDNGGNQRTEEFSADFNTPGGVTGDLPLNAVPAPIAQLTLGLPFFDTDVMLRFLPKINLGDDGSTEMFGIGLKKEITSWFGPLDKLPLHVSLLGTYTSMKVDYNIEDQALPSGDESGIGITDGFAEFDLSAYNVQAIASLNFPIINIYGGFGYSSGDSNFKMNGTYQGRFTYSENGQTFSETVTLTPPDLKFSASGFKSTIGARLSLGFFKIFGAYTLQEYNTFSAGIAISIR